MNNPPPPGPGIYVNHPGHWEQAFRFFEQNCRGKSRSKYNETPACVTNSGLSFRIV